LRSLRVKSLARLPEETQQERVKALAMESPSLLNP
jgi:hypothetical protein